MQAVAPTQTLCRSSAALRRTQIYASRGLVRRTYGLHLHPQHEYLLAALRATSKLFADEITTPVLESVRGRAANSEPKLLTQALGRLLSHVCSLRGALPLNDQP